MPAPFALRAELAGETVGEGLGAAGVIVGAGVTAVLLGGATLGPPPITSQPHSAAASTSPPRMPRWSFSAVLRACMAGDARFAAPAKASPGHDRALPPQKAHRVDAP
jgi:hypothetical protein